MDRPDFNAIRQLTECFLSYVPKQNVFGYMEIYPGNLCSYDLAWIPL